MPAGSVGKTNNHITTLGRIAIALVAWRIVEITHLDEPLMIRLRLAHYGEKPDALLILLFVIATHTRLHETLMPALATKPAHLGSLVVRMNSETEGSGRRPRRRPNNTVEEDALLNALREVVSATRRDNNRRNQIIAALGQLGWSHRRIAPFTDVSESTVYEILKKTTPVELQIRRPLGRTYPRVYPPGSPISPELTQELQDLLDWMRDVHLPNLAVEEDPMPGIEFVANRLVELLEQQLSGWEVLPREVQKVITEGHKINVKRLEWNRHDPYDDIRPEILDLLERWRDALGNLPPTGKAPETP